MSWLYWLSQLVPSEQSLVGEEILVLSQLLQNGYPIFPGFVLENSLLTKFLSNLDNFQFLSQIDIDNYQALQSLAQKSQQQVMAANFSELWQETILDAVAKLNCSKVIIRPYLVNVPGQQQISHNLLQAQIANVDVESIVLGIKKVWAELFTARSIVCWHKLQLELSQIKLNLLIQPWHNSQASGILELSQNEIRIQAIWGLINGLKYGTVQPDLYLLDRQNPDLIEQQLGTKSISYNLSDSINSSIEETSYLVTETIEESLQDIPVLNNQQIQLLVQLGEKITSENSNVKYIEWSIPQVKSQSSDESQFYFYQLGYSSNHNVNQVKQLQQTKVIPIPLVTGTAAAPGKTTGRIFVANTEKINHHNIVSDAILVTKNISFADISLFKKLSGIITETGSLTSHAAIVARELGIPAIVNSTNATTILKPGALVMVDGNEGKVYPGEVVDSTAMIAELDSEDNLNSTSLGIFDYPIGTKLMVNLSQDKILNDVASFPIDGIGLLRSELILLELLKFQTLEQWLQEKSQDQITEQLGSLIKTFALKIAPRPVFYRSFDISSSKVSLYPNNEIVNHRETALSLDDFNFFDLELSALNHLITDGLRNVNLVLPFVRSLEEFIDYRDRFVAQGLANKSCQLWIMAEVPSVIYLLPEYIKAGVQGVVIGTGDLTRLLFGLEREQIDLHRYYDNLAFKNAIADIISITKQAKISCSICLHGTDINSDLITNLINWGITSINVEPQAIQKTYRAIARSERRLILAEIQSRVGINHPTDLEL